MTARTGTTDNSAAQRTTGKFPMAAADHPAFHGLASRFCTSISAGCPRTSIHNRVQEVEHIMDRNSTVGIDELSDLARELDRIKADLRQLRGDIAGLGADTLRAARVGAQEAAKNASNKARAAAEVAEGQVTAHPFLAIATAFTVGAMLGMRLTKRE
jgi:ElaB/YqjD/DUF883 family membrane-anchored ribosome-binding protein